MKKVLLFIWVLAPLLALSQGENVTSWLINTTGHQAQYYNAASAVVDLNDSSEVQQVCYNDDTVYVRANILASFIMGAWPGDPFLADGQNKSYIFPRYPTYPSSTHANKPTGLFGLQINGVALYDDGDGKSYNTSTNSNSNLGAGVWNQIAWVAHTAEMDDGNGHPDPNSIYHNHHNPIQLCSVTDNTQHSPIIGWAFDGWPIYGPFGYSDSLDNTSAIARMTPSWQLRNITTRTTLYDGSTASQTGPAVSATFPLGIYIEDYEFVSGLGDLDYYNGRYCVTPEFPSGTYAYFLNVDATGNASYPSMTGPKFYGSVFNDNFGASGGAADYLVDNAVCYDPIAASALAVTLSSSSNVTCNGLSNGSATVTATGGTGTYTYSWSPSGGSAASATGLAAGTYTVTVNDGSNTVTLSLTITQPSAIDLVTSVTNPTCSSSTNGAVNLTVSGGTTYDSGNPGLVISEILADPTSTDSPFEFVELVATKSINFSTNPYTVIFTNNGIATSDGWIEGGNVTYAFEITTGSVTQGQVVYVGGSSMIPTSNILRSINTSTDGGDGSIGNLNTNGVLGNGGTSADAIAVFSSGTSNITSSTIPVDAIFFGTALGNAVVSAGSAGYQLPVNDAYSGGKLQTTSTFVTNPAVGQYLKATGSYNLQSDTWTTSRTWSNTPTFTNSTSSVSLSSPYSYSWSSGPTTQDLSSLSGGTYTVTVTDAIGCTNTSSASVTAPAAVTGTTSITNVNCFGNSTGAINLTPSGGNASYTYSWNSGATTQDISSIAAGTYSVTITDGNSCTGNVSATVTQPSAALAVTGSTTSTGCSTSVGAINISVTGGTSPYAYSWSNGAISEDISSLAAGTYTVTVTDNKSCTTTGTYTVSSSSGPSLSFTQTNVTCNGVATGAINLTVTGGTGSPTYSWSSGATSEDLSSLLAGTYSVTVTDAASCTATTSVTITQPTALSVSTSNTSILCNGGTATVTVSATGGTTSYTGTGTFTQSAGTTSYAVTDANGCTASQSVTITQPTALSVSASNTSILCNGGTSTVTVSATGGTSSYTGTGTFTQSAGTTSYTVTDANGCTASTSVVLSEPGVIVITPSSTDPSCANNDGQITITTTGGTGTLQYSIDGGSTFQSSDTFFALAGGSYSIVVEDANGCQNSGNTTLTTPSAPTINSVTEQHICATGTGSITVNASGTGTLQYSIDGTTFQSSSVFSGLAAGTYTVYVTDGTSCTSTSSATIISSPSMTISGNIGDEISGNDGSVDITVTGGTSPFSYSWSNSAASEDISGLTAGTYTVTVTDDAGCTAVQSFTVSSFVGITEFEKSSIQAYPNPVMNLLKITSEKTIKNIQIMDINGRTIVVVHPGATEIDMSGLATGTYMLEIITEENYREVIRVVKL